MASVPSISRKVTQRGGATAHVRSVLSKKGTRNGPPAAPAGKAVDKRRRRRIAVVPGLPRLGHQPQQRRPYAIWRVRAALFPVDHGERGDTQEPGDIFLVQTELKPFCLEVLPKRLKFRDVPFRFQCLKRHALVERHYPEFLRELTDRGRSIPTYVEREFESYLKCGRLEHGFLGVRCTACHAERLVAFSCKRRGFCPSCGARRMAESAALLVDAVLPREPIRQWVLSVPFPLRFLFAAEPAAMGQVLGIVYRAIASHLLKKAGLTRTIGRTGAVTLIQRFGSALNLNIHFHMLCLDGAYARLDGPPQFQRVPPPTKAELEALLAQITSRIGRHLERRGLLVRDTESSHLSREPGEDAGLEALQGHSISYRIAVGPHEGRKAFTLQTVPAPGEPRASQAAPGHSGGLLATRRRGGPRQ